MSKPPFLLHYSVCMGVSFFTSKTHRILSTTNCYVVRTRAKLPDDINTMNMYLKNFVTNFMQTVLIN